MNTRNSEQQFINLCNLLDDADLGERHDTVMNLVHSARRASREGQSNVAEQSRIEALRHLRKARHSLQGPGSAPAGVIVIDEAINRLHSVCEKTRTYPFMLNSKVTEPLCYLLIFILLLALVLHFVL